MVVLLSFTLLALYAVPLFRLPRPTGPYAVGTRTLDYSDPARTDPHDPNHGPRRLVVQFWYPTMAVTGTHAPYRRWEETTALSSYMAFLPTSALQNAPIPAHADGYPLLLFHPAWSGLRTQNTAEAMDLASHGYIVAALDHPYNSMLMAVDGDRIIRAAKTPAIDDFTSLTVAQQNARGLAEAHLQAADDTYLLDQLARDNQDPGSWLYRSMDMHHIGALGHSFGGTVAVEAAIEDPRIGCALNMDGWIFGDFRGQGFNKPLFILYEPWELASPAALRSMDTADRRYAEMNALDFSRVMASFNKYGGYMVYLDGARHDSFTDRVFYSPVRKLADGGSAPALQLYHTVLAYTRAFFDHSLKGTPEALLQADAAPLPGCRFTVFPARNDPDGNTLHLATSGQGTHVSRKAIQVKKTPVPRLQHVQGRTEQTGRQVLLQGHGKSVQGQRKPGPNGLQQGLLAGPTTENPCQPFLVVGPGQGKGGLLLAGKIMLRQAALNRADPLQVQTDLAVPRNGQASPVPAVGQIEVNVRPRNLWPGIAIGKKAHLPGPASQGLCQQTTDATVRRHEPLPVFLPEKSTGPALLFSVECLPARGRDRERDGPQDDLHTSAPCIQQALLLQQEAPGRWYVRNTLHGTDPMKIGGPSTIQPRSEERP
jgi:predicted dienelactone hydrolase